MKIRTIITLSFLLLFSAFTLQAQNTLPDPHNDSCWQSLDALRACQLEQYNREADYSQRCTSYPEYQCAPPTTVANSNAEQAKQPSTTNKVSRTNAKQFSRMTNLTSTTAEHPESK
jgi:hypothetical protein